METGPSPPPRQSYLGQPSARKTHHSLFRQPLKVIPREPAPALGPSQSQQERLPGKEPGLGWGGG
jgi:hypothetical protein